MKLRELAKKAAQLPELEFDWAGPEQLNDQLVKSEFDEIGIIDYIIALKHRMLKQSIAISELTKAYNQLRELILDAEIEGLGKP